MFLFFSFHSSISCKMLLNFRFFKKKIFILVSICWLFYVININIETKNVNNTEDIAKRFIKSETTEIKKIINAENIVKEENETNLLEESEMKTMKIIVKNSEKSQITKAPLINEPVKVIIKKVYVPPMQIRLDKRLNNLNQVCSELNLEGNIQNMAFRYQFFYKYNTGVCVIAKVRFIDILAKITRRWLGYHDTFGNNKKNK